MNTKRAFEERDEIIARGDSDLFPREERCFICDDPTGRAGRGDDSIYGSQNDGPYCQECWKNQKPLDDVLEAAECVVATAFGNIHGLTEADQLVALRMAAQYLKEELASFRGDN